MQLTVTHLTPLTSSNLQENLFYDFNGILFHLNVDFCVTHTDRFMVSSLIESRLTCTPPCSTPDLASNIYNIFISNSSPQIPFSFNHVLLSLTWQLTTHAHYISLTCMVFEYRHNIRNQAVSTVVPCPSPFCNSHQQKHIVISVFLYTFFLFFSRQDGTILNKAFKYTFYTYK